MWRSSFRLQHSDLVNLRLHKGYRVPSITLKKLGQQYIGPFKVLSRVGRLAYRLELPDVMRIHDVISITYLEPATDPADDPYQRRRLPIPPVVVDGDVEYELNASFRNAAFVVAVAGLLSTLPDGSDNSIQDSPPGHPPKPHLWGGGLYDVMYAHRHNYCAPRPISII